MDSTGFQRGIQRSKQSVKGFAKSSMATFVRMGAAFAGIGLVKSIVGLGTAAAETASKFEAVFGKSAGKMNEAVKELRKTIPATTAEVQNSLATFAQMAKAIGFSNEAANKYSISMVRIAADLASFNNLSTEEVFTKISAAITGEFEPLKRLGIVINEARLKQEGLTLGIGDGRRALNAQEKAIVVQSIVLKDMGSALGDAARTADSAANRIKFLKTELTETGTKIGVTLLPAIMNLTKGFSVMLSKVTNGMSAVGAVTGKLFVSITKLENGFAGYESVGSTVLVGSEKVRDVTSQVDKEFQELIESTKEATRTQVDFADSSGKTTESLEDQEKALKAIQDQVKNYYDKQKEVIDLERKKFIENKELEVLKLRATGEKAAADALQEKIDKMQEAIRISDKYGISLKKAANLVENISRAEKEPKSSEATTASTSSAAKGRKSRFGAMPTMEERERAAGLYLAGGDPMSGRRPSGMRANDKAAAENEKGNESATLKEMAGSLKVIESTMTE